MRAIKAVDEETARKIADVYASGVAAYKVAQLYYTCQDVVYNCAAHYRPDYKPRTRKREIKPYNVELAFELIEDHDNGMTTSQISVKRDLDYLMCRDLLRVAQTIRVHGYGLEHFRNAAKMVQN